MKIGRNDICPCGSGKKYKKCHLYIEPEKKKHISTAASRQRAQMTLAILAATINAGNK